MFGTTLALLGALLASATALAQPPERFDIAITVDDLPAHGPLPSGMTRADIAASHVALFKARGVPEAFGFVNANRLEQEPDSAAALATWRSAGHPLGNHAYSHLSLDAAPTLAAWQADVAAGEAAVAARMTGQDWRWFRYPYLSTGTDPVRRGAALAWLTAQGYRLAGVSVSFDDWAYTDAYTHCLARNDSAAIGAMKKQYLDEVDDGIARMKAASRQLFGRVIPQVLLTHVGAWSAATLPDVLERLEAAGARYVTLASAQADAAYAQAAGGDVVENEARRRGIALPRPPARRLDPATVCRQGSAD
ncbi:polysaccharide deacetylase family protein [Pseudoduganella plicata]|uniref:Polysaccharide deacetylase n=1 Tax=Pseudoduganella plicata TaxID=321984 RepID=A0A4P7BLE6_9BURK|nr:polysaccharide deacetylase family protein [Pseudoduganella plicata]QBQ38545.1 polysaccharide deacetylase [Pseudoduganella plicata]GGY82951.1 polysaccharide deacetylase [Pseudoduganella plicata]